MYRGIAKEYHYTPYAAIQSVNAKTFLVGVLLRDSTHARRMVEGILETAQENGYRIVFCSSNNSAGEEHKNLVALKNSRIDSLIWEPLSKESLVHLNIFEDSDIAVQLINQYSTEASCGIDFVKLGYTAAQILIDNNHSQIACLLKQDANRSPFILEGFKHCLYDNKINFSDEMILPVDPQETLSAILAYQFTGVVCSHFALTLSFCEEFDKQQYRMPSDLSLISLQDDVRENITYPKISCLKIPYYEFGLYLGNKIINTCEKKQLDIPDFKTECTLDNHLSIGPPFSSKTPKIIVVGSINIDVTLNVDELPQSGQTVRTNHSTVTAGGKGINQSIGVAKLKHPVSLIGKVGNDYETVTIYQALTDNHVDLSGINRDINSETGKAYIHVQQDGESAISISAGANNQLLANDIKRLTRLFKNTSFCLLQSEIPAETVLEAAKTAVSYGVHTVLKPAALKTIDQELLQYIDYFVPNLKEAHLLCPHSSSLGDIADYFLALGAKTVIITLGHDGCFVRNHETCFSVPAIPFTPVDTTGGADAFISALAVYLTRGYPLESSVKIATYAASFCINRQGVVPALIDSNSLEIYIQKKEPHLL